MTTISSRLEGEYSILNSVANKRPRSKLDEVTCWEFNLQKPNVHLYINSQPVWSSTIHDVANNKSRSYFGPTWYWKFSLQKHCYIRIFCRLQCWEFNLHKPNALLYMNIHPVWNSTLHDVANNKRRSYFEPTWYWEFILQKHCYIQIVCRFGVGNST